MFEGGFLRHFSEVTWIQINPKFKVDNDNAAQYKLGTIHSQGVFMKFAALSLLFLTCTLALPAQAQNVIQAEKTMEGVDLCYFKQLQLTGYAYANLIGRCAWDPALNGMQLTLVAMPEDPTQEGQKVEISNVRDVILAQSKGIRLVVKKGDFHLPFFRTSCLGKKIPTP